MSIPVEADESLVKWSPAARPIVHSDDTERWLAERAVDFRIGASEAATILGQNPYESRLGLYYKLTGALRRDDAPGRKALMRWGQRLEEAIALGFCEDTERWGTRHGWMMQSIEHPWMTATPDYAVFDADWPGTVGALECKNMTEGAARKFTELGGDWDVEPPAHFLIQVQHQLTVLDWQRGAVSVLIGGSSPRYYHVHRHPEFCDLLVTRLQEFREDHLLKGVPPPVDDSEATAKALSRLRSSAMEVELPPVSRIWFQRRQELKEQKDAIEAELRGVENEIKAAMGFATLGLVPGNAEQCFSFKEVHKKEYIVRAQTNRELRVVNRRKTA